MNEQGIQLEPNQSLTKEETVDSTKLQEELNRYKVALDVIKEEKHIVDTVLVGICGVIIGACLVGLLWFSVVITKFK